ncbi:MAG: leucine-rich repeat domain-containing protein, partial [Treponema sp.]|nr:leucine-rich repeat domain-containing protein [Treponema sp.]
MRKIRFAPHGAAPIAAFLMMAACAFTLAGCSNTLSEKPEDGASVIAPEGFGSVRVSVGMGAARTAMPTPTLEDFARLEYWFTKSGAEEAVEKTAVDDVFILESGYYTLTVKAYFADTDESPAAEGKTSSSFTVSAGQPTYQTISVALRPIESKGEGSLSFSLSYPADASVETFTLIPIVGEDDAIPLTEEEEPWEEETEDEVITLTGSKDEIPSGYYFLQIVLAKAGYTNTGAREVVHIYQNLDTEVSYSFTDEEFILALDGTISITNETDPAGASKTGDTLTADISDVIRTLGEPAYQWMYADTDTKIPGATDATRRVAYTDLGHTLAVKVTYYNGDITSAPTEPVYLAPIKNVADLTAYVQVLNQMPLDGSSSPEQPFPVPLKLTFNTGTVQDGQIAWKDIAGLRYYQYVSLDLSACTAWNSGTVNMIAGTSSSTKVNDFNSIMDTHFTSIILPDTLTSIGDYAFAYCNGLTSVTIPDSVTSIGASAFDSCIGLTSVTIPDSVTSIGASAFDSCSGLTSVTIPDSVTSIGERAFYSCSLTSVTISGKVTSIGASAFQYCSRLTSVTIPDSVNSIGDYAFSWCAGLTSVTIPGNVTSIGAAAFERCNFLTSVTITGNTVTSTVGEAFVNLTTVTSVTIEEGVTSIGASAFQNYSRLTSVTIPDSVNSIGAYAFQNCGFLTSVTIP